MLLLNGVSYDWRTSEFSEDNYSNGRQIGVIAQDVEKIVPEIVSSDENGYKSVDYSKLAPLLIEAVKEQQKQIEELKSEIEKLKQK